MSKVIVKRPNQKAEIVEFTNGQEWEETKKVVVDSDYFSLDRVHISSKPYEFTMWVDDSGACREDRVLNFYLKTNNIFYPIQPIYGTVVFTRGHLNEDILDYEDVTEEDLLLVNSIMIGRW